ncbi:MAG: alpha/beta hydrolase family protein [Gemmatimonas sp.]
MRGIFALLLLGTASAAHAEDAKPYTEVFYRSGDLRIQAYLYKPAGDGPFPAIVYNHGSREGHERQSVPWVRIAAVYTKAGFVVLVPERRGYGTSDGLTFREAVGKDVGTVFINRLRDEADDVIAAAEYLRTVPFVDSGRIGVSGHSFGGIVTVFSASRTDAFKVAIDLAGGALTWKRSAALRNALVDAAEHARAPMLLLVAANDRTTESVTALDEAMTQRGLPHEAKIYPPYTPPRQTSNPAGHELFGADGAAIWGGDVIAFARRYLD